MKTSLQMTSRRLCKNLLYCCLAVLLSLELQHALQLSDYTHYLDYLPYRQEGLVGFEGFLTNQKPPVSLRDRKMDIGPLKLSVEDVFQQVVWPAKWPYTFEDFRPLDYTNEEIINTGVQYQLSQSLIMTDKTVIFPGLNVPIKRHFVFPKDKIALSEHVRDEFFDGAKVLELFSCYESILPSGIQLGPTVG